MGPTSIGDLATSLIMRSRNARLKDEISGLAQELSTGKTASLEKTVSGKFRAVGGIEQTLSQTAAYDTAAAETAGFADATQDALEAIRNTAGRLATDLLSAGTSRNLAQARRTGASAVQALGTVVSRLNTSFANRSLFAGTATDRNALQDADEMLSAIVAAVSGETTATGIVSVLDAWFGPGGGFETGAYLGSATPLQPMEIAPGVSATLGVTASDPEIRDLLKGLALAALVDRAPSLAGTEGRFSMAMQAGEMLLASDGSILELQAATGVAQEAIVQARVQNAATRASMEMALAEIVSVDSYEAATRLEQAESQLEALYALTARASRLKLTDFL